MAKSVDSDEALVVMRVAQELRTPDTGSTKSPSPKITDGGINVLTRFSPETLKSTTKVVVRAIEASTVTRIRAVRFALGVPVGFLLSMVAATVISSVYPLTAPMALLWLVLPLTIATAILSAWFLPMKDVFTNEELSNIDRAKHVLELKDQQLEAREAQMRENGLEGPAIEAALGPERDKAQQEYFGILSDVQAKATPKALGTGEKRPPD